MMVIRGGGNRKRCDDLNDEWKGQTGIRYYGIVGIAGVFFIM